VVLFRLSYKLGGGGVG